MIEAHRKRQQMGQKTPMIVMIGAAALLIIGAGALIFGLLDDSGKPSSGHRHRDSHSQRNPDSDEHPPATNQHPHGDTAPNRYRDHHPLADRYAIWTVSTRFKKEIRLAGLQAQFNIATPVPTATIGTVYPTAVLPTATPTP